MSIRTISCAVLAANLLAVPASAELPASATKELVERFQRYCSASVIIHGTARGGQPDMEVVYLSIVSSNECKKATYRFVCHKLDTGKWLCDFNSLGDVFVVGP
jgi:hypothetical protein